MKRLDLEFKLKQSDASSFQRLCDCLLSKLGFNIVPYGNCEGKNAVRKGTPDSYILNEDEKRMIFVEYTTQINDIGNKIIDDIQKCLEKKEKFKEYKLDKIFYFVNSNNIDPQKIDEITALCNENNIEFKLYNQFEICALLCHYKSVIKEIFGEMFEDDLLISLDDFIDYTKVLKGVDHSFQFIERNDEEKKIEESISSKIFTVISGEPGVGKSMLAVQILKKYSNNVVCVRKSNENALDYVFERTNCLDNLIIFIDDINEISSLKRFVESLSLNKNNKIKIVCTVRDYALASIKNVVELYSFSYSIIKVNRVSKDVVKQIIEKNLSIKNSKVLEKIADISRGNPRLAKMTGKVVLSEGTNCLCDSKEIVKKYFEISTNDAIKKIINEYLTELCFIAFMKNVEKNNLSSYSDAFQLFNIDEKKFIESINILNSLEIISLFEDAVIQIDDQNLSDYILGKYFIDLKCCSISDLIVKLIRTRRNQIVECINIILNICSDESSRLYVKNEVLKAWNIFEGTSDYDYFIKSFYPMNIDKSLIFYNSKLNSFYKTYKGNFEVYDSTYGRNEEVDILTDICKRYDGSFHD